MDCSTWCRLFNIWSSQWFVFHLSSTQFCCWKKWPFSQIRVLFIRIKTDSVDGSYFQLWLKENISQMSDDKYSNPPVNNRTKCEILKSIIFIAQPTSNISNLLDMFSFATWTIYFLTFSSIVVMRFRNGAKFHDPDESRMPKRLQNHFCLA